MKRLSGLMKGLKKKIFVIENLPDEKRNRKPGKENL